MHTQYSGLLNYGKEPKELHSELANPYAIGPDGLRVPPDGAF